MNRKRDASRNHGGALILTVILLLFMGVMAGSLFTVQLQRDRLKEDYANKIEAYYGSEGATDYAMELIWDGFLKAGGGKAGSLTAFQGYLDSSSTLTIPKDQWTPVPLTSFHLAPGAVSDVSVLRTAGGSTTDLRFRSSVTVLDHTETLETVFRAEGTPFKGFEFGLLSNNISCIFCHAKISSVGKFSGGPYERVRVASLESLMVRTSASSQIYGTLYTMGKLMDNSGDLLADLSTTTLQGYSMVDNTIDPASTTLINLVPAPTGADGKPLPGYNFYKDYPADPANQGDGDVPRSFPSVFTDENVNKIVDDSELSVLAGYANGTVSGYGFVVPGGSSFGGASLSTSSTVAASGVVDGNLILTGTAANPIRIDGRLVVNGDVIVKGVVQGTGSIIARGNLYVPGDVTYNDAVVDGQRQYGTASDGSVNNLGLAAGGNILVGDYLTPKKGSLTSTTSLMTGNTANGFGFVLSEISLFNRREWQKTQPTLPDVSGKQVANGTYTPGYVPKYYKIDPSSPVWVYTSGLYWDNAKQSWMGSEHAGNFTAMTVVTPPAGAVISSLNPTASWVTPTQLKQFWIEDESKRPTGSPFKIDALLYTDSSVFTLARGASKTAGNMIINGALVARDTGVLAGGTLEINYDCRVQELLNIRDTTEVFLVKTVMIRRNPTITR